MSNHLIEFLSQFVNLTNDEINFIEQHGAVKHYNKGDILLKEGQTAKNTFLVLKGCVKSFYLAEGEEHITEFYTENNLIVPAGYAQQTPSTYFLSCLKDCVISTGTIEGTGRFLKHFPRLAQICLQISNNLIAKQQLSFHEYRLLSPEIRYNNFVQTRPELVNNIPQYMIANYLGIKPQSLSRIRKRLIKKDSKVSPVRS